MRDYGKVSPQFWIGRTGKSLRSAGAEAQLVSLYLLTNPHANMIGLYYMPLMFIAHETGLGMEGASKGLTSAIKAGFCHYDEQSEMVWVPEMAAHQIGSNLSPKDKRCPGVQNEYNAQPDNPFLSMFYDKYQIHYHMTVRRGALIKMSPNRKGLRRGLQAKSRNKSKRKNKIKTLCPIRIGLVAIVWIPRRTCLRRKFLKANLAGLENQIRSKLLSRIFFGAQGSERTRRSKPARHFGPNIVTGKKQPGSS